jgi:hypothetical protein
VPCDGRGVRGSLRASGRIWFAIFGNIRTVACRWDSVISNPHEENQLSAQ